MAQIITPCLQFSSHSLGSSTHVVSLSLKTTSFISSSRKLPLFCNASFDDGFKHKSNFKQIQIESRSPLMEAKRKAYGSLEGLDSPITTTETESADDEIMKIEVGYQRGLAQEPNNVLLLANYAQFLYLVVHDFDRAEDYFKRAIKVEPKDAEAHNKYANFLWQVRNDLWAAEETFLEAISADPSNSYYAASYAHFLWNTGGEDTCFPLDSIDNVTLES